MSGKRPAAKKPTPTLAVDYTPLGKARRWERNPKPHDLDGIKDSIRRYGFRDAPIFDKALGAIVAGNGRIQALQEMRAAGEDAPLGIAVDAKGEWWVPIQKGLDAKSKAEAEAFGLDHNNLTVAGGPRGVDAMLELWDRGGLADLLRDLEAEGALPGTLKLADLDVLLPEEDTPEGAARERMSEAEVTVLVGQFRFLVDRETYEDWSANIRTAGSDTTDEACIAVIRERLGL